MAGAVVWVVSAAVLWSAMAACAAQDLPSGGGQIPELRRGAGGQIEVVRPSAPARQPERSHEKPPPRRRQTSPS